MTNKATTAPVTVATGRVDAEGALISDETLQQLIEMINADYDRLTPEQANTVTVDDGGSIFTVPRDEFRAWMNATSATSSHVPQKELPMSRVKQMTLVGEDGPEYVALASEVGYHLDQDGNTVIDEISIIPAPIVRHRPLTLSEDIRVRFIEPDHDSWENLARIVGGIARGLPEYEPESSLHRHTNESAAEAQERGGTSAAGDDERRGVGTVRRTIRVDR